MTPERYQRIGQLFDEALNLSPERRASFLDQACGADVGLRAEIEKLLARHQQADEFLSRPAMDVAAELLASNQQPLALGQQISHYQVLSLLGAGGMGEIYLAQDTKLDRKVALKLLPGEFTRDEDRVRRFVQEAKAASALNHPNIITIHEIGEADAAYYLVTEYIEGQTLRRRMGARMKRSEVLEVAGQVASALAAAHAAGIVHRDIKPENVMLRPDGLVKVLDFGLAKLTERRASSVDVDAPTAIHVKTSPGTVMGTVSYMSPEQAAGEEVDARSDLWSLGVVLYEMVAGQLPFTGKDIHRQIIAIQEQAPLLLSRHTEGVPDRLEEIVTKALAKDPDERYQTAKDLLIDLRHLKKRLEAEVELNRTPELRSAMSGAGESTDSLPPATASPSAAQTAGPTHATSSAEYLVGEIKRHQRSVGAALAVLVIVMASLAYFLFSGRGGQALDSIAVLPFVNASQDPNTEYLSDGISETLINSLSQLQRLRVIARTTAFRYRGKEVDPQAVGRELKVRAVLTGRVRQEGETLNIQADLVDVTTGAQLWGEEYQQRKVSDLLAVKQEISKEITEKLRLRLTGEEQKQLTRHDTANTEAYQFYLRGRYYWNKRAGESLKKAIQEFKQAADKDPNYALAFVGLADCYVLLEEYAGTPASETLPQAKAFATRALQIDDSLGEAHASLGLINSGLWQWAEAERHFKRAIELNPTYPTAHQWYCTYLRDTGRLDEALSEIKRAQALDPLASIINVNVGIMYLAKGDAKSAAEQLEKTIDLDPNYWTARSWLGLAYLSQGRPDQALAEMQKGVELSHRSGRSLGFLGNAKAITGKRAEALSIVKELEASYAKHGATVQNVAMVYTGLGNKDQAFVWLEKNFQARSGEFSRIVWYPQFEPLRSDPRYADLLQRMGLKP